MKKQEIIDRVFRIAEPLAAAMAYEIVDVEYEKAGSEWYLRIYADREGGFTLDDCVAFSHALDEKLDEEDLIEGAYHLQVSSPGLDRPLIKDRDFERKLGELVEVRLFAPLKDDPSAPDGKEWTAVLKDYDAAGGIIILETEDGKEVRLDKKKAALIRPAVIW